MYYALQLTLLAMVVSGLAAEHGTRRRVVQARRDICQDPYEHSLGRRAPVEGDANVGVTVSFYLNDVSLPLTAVRKLPSVGLSLGNITTKLGNINLTSVLLLHSIVSLFQYSYLQCDRRYSCCW